MGSEMCIRDRNEAGTPTRLQIHPQRWHDFQLHAGVLADSDQALMTCARFIHQHAVPQHEKGGNP